MENLTNLTEGSITGHMVLETGKFSFYIDNFLVEIIIGIALFIAIIILVKKKGWFGVFLNNILDFCKKKKTKSKKRKKKK